MFDICVTFSERKDQNLSIVMSDILANKFYDFVICVCVCVCVYARSLVDRVTVQKCDRS